MILLNAITILYTFAVHLARRPRVSRMARTGPNRQAACTRRCVGALPLAIIVSVETPLVGIEHMTRETTRARNRPSRTDTGRPTRMTKAEAQAFKARWALVNAAERKEMRTTPTALKLRQLSTLMDAATSLGWVEDLAAGEAEVRQRWNQLRRLERG